MNQNHLKGLFVSDFLPYLLYSQWFMITLKYNDPCPSPEMSGAIPHHLLLLQGQSLNHAFTVINKLAVQRFLHGSHDPCSVQQTRHSVKPTVTMNGTFCKIHNGPTDLR